MNKNMNMSVRLLNSNCCKNKLMGVKKTSKEGIYNRKET